MSSKNGSAEKKGSLGHVNPTFVNDPRLGEKTEFAHPGSSDNSVTDETSNVGETRDRWGSPMEFLLSCISMSVGLGNVWRFPSVAYENGGGAFLIPYLIVLIFIGRPLYFLEMVLGQFSSSGSAKIWNVVPFAKGIGYGQAIATWCVVSYYVYLMALAFFYLCCSFEDPLPWTLCDPAWVPDNSSCYSSSENLTNKNVSGLTTSTEFFFNNYVLNKAENIDSGIGTPDWRLSLCLLLCWIIIFVVLVKGVASSGKVAYFTALFPYVVLITLLIRGCTLPGAGEGILFFITPDFNAILSADVWYAAVTQCFFSLSVGFGPIVTFASYNPFRHRIYRDSTIVSLADTGTSILAGITIFSILGNLAYETDQLDDIGSVVSSGTGLAFVSYPEAISKFDDVPQLFAVLFFLMLITLAIGSASGLASCIITIISDDFPKANRLIVTASVCAASFLVGLIYVTPGGLYMLDLVDYFGGGFIIYVMVIFQTIFLCWAYGLDRIVNDIRFMLGFGVSIYWKLTWCFVIPIALIVIFVYAMVTYTPLQTDDEQDYPIEATVAGWMIAVVAILQIPGWGLWTVYKNKKVKTPNYVRASFRPADEWGPADPKIKQEWIRYNEVDAHFSWVPKFLKGKCGISA